MFVESPVWRLGLKFVPYEPCAIPGFEGLVSRPVTSGSIFPDPTAVYPGWFGIREWLSLDRDLPGLFGQTRVDFFSLESQSGINEIGEFWIIIKPMKLFDACHWHREEIGERIEFFVVHIQRTPGEQAPGED